jgi:hypothetical protein
MSGASRDAERPSYEQLEALVAELRARIVEQERVIAELRARLDQSSRNSSRPCQDPGRARIGEEQKEPESLCRTRA